MNVLQKTGEDKSVLQWGGLAGVLGGIIFILVFVIVGVFAGMGPVDVMRDPDVRTALKVGDNLKAPPHFEGPQKQSASTVPPGPQMQVC